MMMRGFILAAAAGLALCGLALAQVPTTGAGLATASTTCPGTTYSFTSGSLPGGVTMTGGANTSYYNSSFQLVNSTANSARFTYIPDTGAGPFLLVEPANTNNIIHSETVSTSPWSPSDVTFITGNTDPRGGTAAIELREDSATNFHGVDANQGANATPNLASTAITYSAYVKQFTGTRSAFLRISDSALAGNVSIVMNPSTGAVITAVATGGTYSGTPTSTIQKINISGNVWWRVTITATSNAGTSNARASAYLNGGISYAGDNSSGWLFFGVQASPSSTTTLANSYIPTTTAQVTSTADAVAFTQAAHCGHVTYTFDDNSTQTVAQSAGSVTIPTNLNRPWIKQLQEGT